MVRREILTSFHFASFAFILFHPFPPTRSPSAPSPANHSAQYFISPSTRVYSTTYVYPNAACAATVHMYRGNARSTKAPPKPTEGGGEGYLDSGKVRDRLVGCFVLVLILHFSRVFLFLFFFFKLAMAILLAS